MKKYKKIKFYAFRDNKGATGGPGGVLYLQKNLIGDNLNGIECRYYFREKKEFSKSFYKGAFLKVFFKELLSFNNYYICNEIGTAFALACLNRKYSLIYHQQGPIIEELTNFGNKLSKHNKKILHFIEKNAFINAQTLHFPSKGAEKMYFNSLFRSCNIQDVRIGEVLPNTIEIKEYEPPIKPSPDKTTLLCVGTLTKAKGQDITLNFIGKLLQKSNKKFRLIMVGSGPLEKELIKKGKELEKNHLNFEFIYRKSLPHEEIMRLHKISDIYIMLHRISIFDLATLEAMSTGNAIVLSNVGGNIDFNIDENIILVENKKDEVAIDKILNANIDFLKNKNLEIFNNYFSAECFSKNYKKVLEEIIK